MKSLLFGGRLFFFTPRVDCSFPLPAISPFLLLPPLDEAQRSRLTSKYSDLSGQGPSRIDTGVLHGLRTYGSRSAPRGLTPFRYTIREG